MKKFANILKQIPMNPGIYMYRNSDDIVIYVGKAKNLFNRVNSYFTGKKDPKTEALVKKIAKIDFFVTENETEALILENNMIKKYMPRYNILLKDSKSYPFIKVTSEPIPRIYKCREKVSKSGTFFGPYVNSEQADNIILILNKVLKLRKCRHALKEPFNRTPCLNYHMQLCCAPCASLISRKEYLRRIKTAKDFLSGNTESLIKKLTKEMEKYSKALKFEKAAEIRDQIKQVYEIKPDQFMQENNSTENNDYVGLYQDGETAAVSIISVRNGIVNDKKNFLFTQLLPDTEFISDFFNLYYLNEIFLPNTIFFRDIFLDKELFYSAIEKKRGCKITIEKPTIQKDRRLTKLAIDNAEIFYEEKKLKSEKIHHLRELKKILHMNKIPRKIECFDIATLNGKFNTAAMSVFIDGVPDRTLYRQFNIEGEGHPDDYTMMKEVMARRYQRLQIEKKDFPDLILLDGGKGQLNAAAEIIDLLGIDISMASIAEKEEIIFIRDQKEPIILPRSSYALKIIQHIRDEAHRFSNTRLAIRYKNDSLKTQLENIPGIGKARAKFLLDTYGSVEKIKTLSQEELAKLPQIGDRLAENLYRFFHQYNQE